MDIQPLIMPIVVIAFGLFAGATWAWKYASTKESFSWARFLPTMGVGGLAAMALYLATGALPSLDAVFTEIATMMPGGAPSLSIIIAALLAIWNQISKGSTTVTTTTNTPAAQAAATTETKATLPVITEEVFDPGFTVTPTFPEIKSGASVGLKIQAGVAAVLCRIDWLDGTIDTKPFAPGENGGVIDITHVYTFVKDAHYSGHTFYPKFTISDAQGKTLTFNDVAGKQGVCCSVGVSAI